MVPAPKSLGVPRPEVVLERVNEAPCQKIRSCKSSLKRNEIRLTLRPARPVTRSLPKILLRSTCHARLTTLLMLDMATSRKMGKCVQLA